MNKVLINKILIIFLSAYLLFGCTNSINSSQNISQHYAQVILDCLKEKVNEDELITLFCKKVNDTHDLKNEIMAVRAFIEGDIISDGEWYAMSEAGSLWKDGEKIESYISPRMKNIETSLNKQYTISFFAYVIYVIDEELVGVTRITIRDTETNETCTIGEVIVH